MKKDIIFHPVEGVHVAIVRNKKESESSEDIWQVVLLNRKPETITNVFVTSKGYGSSESGTNTDQKTSTLRHFFQEIAAGDHVVVEPIMPEVFHLYNEYWISYFVGNQIYDKKFIFVPDSIVEDNVMEIAQLGMEGVLHQ